MTPQEELKQIYKEGIEIDLREDSYNIEIFENFKIAYFVTDKFVEISHVENSIGEDVFTSREVEDLENFLTESNQKDGISDAKEFGNINY